MLENNKCTDNVTVQAAPEKSSKSLDIYKNPNIPFIHRFETKKNKYIFDVNTMQIVRVDPVVWDIVNDCGAISKGEIVARYSARYSPERVSSAYDEILDAQQQKGLFLQRRPKEILMPFTEQYIRQKVDNERTLTLLNVTENCNFRCLYCIYNGDHVSRRPHSKRHMSWDVAKRAIDDYLEHSGGAKMHAIGFYGGEPLLNFPLIRKCVAYVRIVWPDGEGLFSVTTNGSMLKGEVADFLACEDFNINVSLDGPEDIHDRYRRTKDGSQTWDCVISNIEAFLKKYPQYKTNSKIGFNVVIAPPLDIYELNDFLSSYELCSERMRVKLSFVNTRFAEKVPPVLMEEVQGLRRLYTDFVNNLATGKINKDFTNPKFLLQRAIFEEDWVKFHKRPKPSYLAENGRAFIPEKFCSLSTCTPGVRRTFVSVSGDYYICERVPETDYFKVGDVEQGFDIPRIRQLLEEWVDLSKEHCRFCWCLPVCQVGCWSNVCEGTKPTVPLKRNACVQHLARMRQLLVDYCSVLENNPHALDYIDNISIG